MSLFTKEQVQGIVDRHNNRVDTFYNKVLPEKLGIKPDEKVGLDVWFRAQDIIQKEGLYQMAKAICVSLDEEGFDVKMNMQTYKLMFFPKQ